MTLRFESTLGFSKVRCFQSHWFKIVTCTPYNAALDFTMTVINAFKINPLLVAYIALSPRNSRPAMAHLALLRFEAAGLRARWVPLRGRTRLLRVDAPANATVDAAAAAAVRGLYESNGAGDGGLDTLWAMSASGGGDGEALSIF